MKIRPKTLQQQLILFVLVPVALLLMGLGWSGFVYTRNTLLRQWGEATTLKLQRAAHQIDMELNRPKSLVAMLFNGNNSRTHGQHALENLIVEELKGLDGVLRVEMTPTGNSNPESALRSFVPTEQPADPSAAMGGARGMPRSHHGLTSVRVTSPRYDASLDNKTVSLVSGLTASDGRLTGNIELVLSFDHLVGLITEAEWWQHQEAFIVDANGRVLAGTTDSSSSGNPADIDPLPEALVEEMALRFSGTVRTRNGEQDRVSGFYRLTEAPWTLVVSAPANEVLVRINRFRIVYLALGVGIVISVLLLIRLTTARAVRSIREVSQAAERVAIGDYDIHLPVRGTDEIGELMQRFNTMARQLEEGALMKRSLMLAQEVQQSLLPAGCLATSQLEVAGTSRYCDETGGDYFDYIRLPRHADDVQPTVIVVGDVTGHGIAAALLMSTARALLRLRIALSGNLGHILTDVNRLLCADTVESGSFITLFLLCFEPDGHRITWVRAGHDPALLYDPGPDRFTELGGEGIALGVDAAWEFSASHYGKWGADQVLIIGTDGIWEAENQAGERFGKERLKTIVRRKAADTSQEILEAVIDAIEDFRGARRTMDDITLVVIKRRTNGETDRKCRLESGLADDGALDIELSFLKGEPDE